MSIFSFKLNSTFPLSKAEEIRLTPQQELSVYLNRNLAKHKLNKTALLNEKNHIEIFLEKGEKEKHQLVHQMDNIRNKISELKGKMNEIQRKFDECKEKIEFYSK